MKYKLASVWLLLASFIAACSFVSVPSVPIPSLPWSSAAVESNPTAEALFKDGITQFNNKRYGPAIDRLQRLRTEFPFSPQVISAELKIAEAYYLNKQYPEAVSAFKEFHALHPTNENIPLVLYHLGMAHFDQFTAVDRDQKMTHIAKSYFETVMKNHPNSPYAAQAKEKVAKCLEYLAEQEFHIASFYMGQKKYPAARERLEEILRRYKETPTAAKSLYRLGESYRLEKNSVKAALAYEALIQHYPESPLAKEARIQLAQLEKEKHDPLALLLMRDRRPATQLAGGEIRNSKFEIRNEKNLNLVAKKEVVREEPGEEKGMLRRVADTVNPFAWLSSNDKDDKKENGDTKAPAPSKKEDSPGLVASLWSGINPFASSKQENKKSREAAPTANPSLVGKIDESLKQRGIVAPENPQIENRKSKIKNPQSPGLPQIEEATPPPTTNTATLVGDIDAKLKTEGKNAAELPPPPEAAPSLRTATVRESKPPTSKAETSPSPSAQGLIAGIDEALKRKGIEPGKFETTKKTAGGRTGTVGRPSSVSGQKVELAPRLGVEQGPLFLDPAELKAQEKPSEGEQHQPQPAKSTEPSKQLPQAVVKGPPQAKDKPETKVTENRTPQADEEEKGILDQLREDLGKLRGLLNPFGW